MLVGVGSGSCPVLVGRDAELAELVSGLDAAVSGRGGAIVLVGEAGIGKSRLAQETTTNARRRGMNVLAGRAVEGGRVAFRPLHEALLSHLRTAGPPATPELVAFRPALARLVPEWRSPGRPPAEESLVVLGEAVVRLLRVVAGEEGCLLVLEDLHWADPESLEIFEYLADNIATEPVLCVGTFRTGEAGGALARARQLSARRAATIVDVDRLTDTEVVEMAAACLGEPVLSVQVRDVLRSAADGVPFFVEELLADEAAAVGSTLAVPVSFAETVRRRLREATPEARAVLHAAAVLGRHFEWRLLPDACELVEASALAGLRWAVEAQLLAGDQDGEAGGGRFVFRHALTREAVLGDVLAPERARLAGRALKAIELAHPGLAGDWCELAADMAEQAGERARAAQLMLEAGRRSLGLGALATAEAALHRAGGFAADLPALCIDIDEALIEVLALAGRIDEVEDVGDGLLTRLAGQDAGAARRARAHLRLARAAIVASRWDIAEGHLRPVHDLDQNLDPVLLVEADVLGAQLALGQGQLDQARKRAEAALTDAQRIVRPELACEALEVLGRRARQVDLGAAEAAFDQARQIAEQHGLTLWRLRALHELGTIDLLGGGPVDRLLMARDGAAAVGALATAVTVDVQISAWYANRFRGDEAMDAARSCAEVAHRLRLGILEALGLLFQAGAHAMAGRRAEMEAAVTEALGLAGDDPEIAGLASLQMRALFWLLREDRARAMEEMERGMILLRPTPVTAPSRGLWALLRTLADLDGDAARAEVRASGLTVYWIIRGFVGHADTVALGRQGDRVGADAAFAAADADLSPSPWYRHYCRRLVAEAAITDGWGEPVTWLRDALAFFGDDWPRLATACRSLLGRAGATVPRKRDAGLDLPPALRSLGVTRREMDVLALLAEGRSTRDIAARLYLSPKTVERHVANLAAKAGVGGRAQLIAFAAGLTPDTA